MPKPKVKILLRKAKAKKSFSPETRKRIAEKFRTNRKHFGRKKAVQFLTGFGS